MFRRFSREHSNLEINFWSKQRVVLMCVENGFFLMWILFKVEELSLFVIDSDVNLCRTILYHCTIHSSNLWGPDRASRGSGVAGGVVTAEIPDASSPVVSATCSIISWVLILSDQNRFTSFTYRFSLRFCETNTSIQTEAEGPACQVNCSFPEKFVGVWVGAICGLTRKSATKQPATT